MKDGVLMIIRIYAKVSISLFWRNRCLLSCDLWVKHAFLECDIFSLCIIVQLINSEDKI